MESESTTDRTEVLVDPGHGVGPEVTEGIIRILNEADSSLRMEKRSLSSTLSPDHHSSSVPESTEKIRSFQALLKGPYISQYRPQTTTVSNQLSNTLSLESSVQKFRTYPYSSSDQSRKVDLVLLHQNTDREDPLRSSDFSAWSEFSSGSFRHLCRLACDYASAHERDRVACAYRKNNEIASDIFDSISTDYSSLASSHLLLSTVSEELANHPERFDVLLLTETHSSVFKVLDHLLNGRLKFSPIAHVGETFGIFGPRHGPMPDIAGEGMADPTGLLRSTLLMLDYVGHHSTAKVVHNAWHKTIEDGFRLPFTYNNDSDEKLVDTVTFIDSVVERLGESASELSPIKYSEYWD
ncbi:MAG: isocitrate/isopropylmalate family dehydrogenase [Salinibacter sp.]